MERPDRGRRGAGHRGHHPRRRPGGLAHRLGRHLHLRRADHHLAPARRGRLLPLGRPAHRPLGRRTGAPAVPAGDPARRRHRGGVRQRRGGPAADPHRAGHPAAPRLQTGGGVGLHRGLRVRGGLDQPAAGDLEPRQHRLGELLRHLVQPLRGRDGAGGPRLAGSDPGRALVVLPARPALHVPGVRAGSAAPRDQGPARLQGGLPSPGPVAGRLLRDGTVRRAGLGRHLRRRPDPAQSREPEPGDPHPQGAGGSPVADRSASACTSWSTA